MIIEFFDTDYIEEGTELIISQPNTFYYDDEDKPTGLEIVDDETTVGLLDVSYRIKFYTHNPIPAESILYITWPTDWYLDCSDIEPECVSKDLKTTCPEECAVCNEEYQRLELTGCFEDIFIDPETDYVDIQLDGLKNPDDTAEYSIAVTTLQTTTYDSNLYIIDYSNFYYTDSDDEQV